MCIFDNSPKCSHCAVWLNKLKKDKENDRFETMDTISIKLNAHFSLTCICIH